MLAIRERDPKNEFNHNKPMIKSNPTNPSLTEDGRRIREKKNSENHENLIDVYPSTPELIYQYNRSTIGLALTSELVVLCFFANGELIVLRERKIAEDDARTIGIRKKEKKDEVLIVSGKVSAFQFCRTRNHPRNSLYITLLPLTAFYSHLMLRFAHFPNRWLVG